MTVRAGVGPGASRPVFLLMKQGCGASCPTLHWFTAAAVVAKTT